MSDYVHCCVCGAIFPIADHKCPSCNNLVVDECRQCGKPLTRSIEKEGIVHCPSCGEYNRSQLERERDEAARKKVTGIETSDVIVRDGDLDNVERARELVDNYRHALAYLNGVAELTYADFRQAIHLAGTPVSESETRQQWEMAKMTLAGTESLRQTYREVWEKGIEVFGQIARELPRIRQQESQSPSQSRQKTSTRKWWEFWK